MQKLFQTLVIFPVLIPAMAWPLANFGAGFAAVFLGSIFFVAFLLNIKAGREILIPVPCMFAIFVALISVLSFSINEVVVQVSLIWTLIVLVSFVFVVVALRSFYVVPVLEGGPKHDYFSLLARSLLIAGFLYSVASLLLYYNISSLVAINASQGGSRLKGLWGQPNLTTTTLWLSLVSLFYLSSGPLSKAKKFFYSMVCFTLLWALALAASRINYLFLVVLLGVGLFSIRGNSPVQKRLGIIWMLGAVLVCLSLILFPKLSQPLEIYLVEQGLLDKSAGISIVDREVFDSPRVVEHKKIYGSLSGMSAKEWFFGFGHGQYSRFSMDGPFQPHQSAGTVGTFSHSHNLFSNVFIEWGLFGLVGTLIICCSVIHRLWLNRGKPEFLFAATVMSIIFMHSMTEYPLWYPWFLFLAGLFVLPLYGSWRVPVTSRWLFLIAGGVMLVLVVLLGWNVTRNFWVIQTIAMSDHRTEEHYRELSLLANDSLLGPYAVLTKYRVFPPEELNLKWQLDEAREMASWRPLDVVMVREATLLLMLDQVQEACEVSRNTAKHYPASGPILVEKAVRIASVDMAEVAIIANCVEEGLKVWDETLDSMQKKNQKRIDALRSQEQALSGKGRPGW